MNTFAQHPPKLQIPLEAALPYHCAYHEIMANFYMQILRWSALGAGVLYGVYHQASLSSSAKLAAINRQYEHKQKLIDEAKAEYTKKNLPPSAKTAGGDSMFIHYLWRA